MRTSPGGSEAGLWVWVSEMHTSRIEESGGSLLRAGPRRTRIAAYKVWLMNLRGELMMRWGSDGGSKGDGGGLKRETILQVGLLPTTGKRSCCQSKHQTASMLPSTQIEESSDSEICRSGGTFKLADRCTVTSGLPREALTSNLGTLPTLFRFPPLNRHISNIKANTAWGDLST